MSEVTPTSSSAVTQKRRGLGAAIGGALAALTGALVGGTSKIFGEVANRGGTALAGFRARPEHSRWRAYALGSYGVLFAGTLAAQLWSANPLGVYVKVQQVEIPRTTFIFVRNDSRQAWHHARLTLNGIYTYERDDVNSGDNLRLEPQQFTVLDSVSGKQNKFPKNGRLESLAMDCDQGHYETELKP